MAYCTKCGREVDEGDGFCHACGGAVTAPGGAGAAASAGVTPLPPTTAPGTIPVPPQAAATYPGQAREETPQEIAERRVKHKLELWWHLGSYVIVNLFLVIVWALTGRGYPWFVWVMVGWGIGLAFHIMQYFMTVKGEPRRQHMIHREMEKMQRQQGVSAGEPERAAEEEK